MMSQNSCVLITGAAGFIGFHLARRFHQAGYQVICADKAVPTHDIGRVRFQRLGADGMTTAAGDLSDASFTDELFSRWRPAYVLHMAAHTNARSNDEQLTEKDNLTALKNVLRAAAHFPPRHFIFASTSSVYGENAPRPFREDTPLQPVDTLYGESKRVGETWVGEYAAAGKFSSTIIRFFNVYGPWGRPDMAPLLFTDCIARDLPVPLLRADTYRAWLFIKDAVDACFSLTELVPAAGSPPRIVNVAGPDLILTETIIEIIATLMEKTPRINDIPSPPEVSSNPADVSYLRTLIGFAPQTTFPDGMRQLVHWYREEWSKIIPGHEQGTGQ